MNLREFFWKLQRISPLAWGIILILVALLLVKIDGDFAKKLATLSASKAVINNIAIKSAEE